MSSPTKRTAIQRSGHTLRRNSSSGLTIMELLVASAISLLMVAGLVTAFQVISDQVASARAVLEISGQLRIGQHVIREDVSNVSAPVRPWLRPADGHGYFEYFEGPMHDRRTPGNNDSIVGDIDDIIMFTARSELEPFRGRFNGGVITSREAEIIIWARWDDADGNGQVDPEEQVTVHRRVLLVRPDLTLPAVSLANFYQANDVSARVGPTRLMANSLSDLTKRENRFAHLSNSFPFRIDRAFLESLAQSRANEPNEGRDVVLSNVLTFDVQAYDPLVEVRRDPNGVALLPHDNGYNAAAGVANVIGVGGYVDLNYVRAGYVSSGSSHFSGTPHPLSRLGNNRSYCTWPFHYESDGVNQDGDGATDEGTDGFDNNNVNGVDEFGERETAPPYPHPLRGIKITLRVYEQDSQAIRQTSIVTDFIPE